MYQDCKSAKSKADAKSVIVEIDESTPLFSQSTSSYQVRVTNGWESNFDVSKATNSCSDDSEPGHSTHESIRANEKKHEHVASTISVLLIGSHLAPIFDIVANT
jgi:putative IMPACT (imprinted ancient) family translation regulator